MAEYLIQDTTLSAIADRIRDKTESAAVITPESMPQGVDDVYDAGIAVGDADMQLVDTAMDELLAAQEELTAADTSVNLFNAAHFAEDTDEYGILNWSSTRQEFSYAGPPNTVTSDTLRAYAPNLIIGKTYTLSYKRTSGYFGFSDVGYATNPETFVLTAEIYDAQLSFGGDWDDYDYVCRVSEIMLNLGDSAAPYVPYEEPNTFAMRRTGVSAVLNKIENAEDNSRIILAFGKQQGEVVGYANGYAKGNEEGYNTGYNAGYGDGLASNDEARQEGYDEGYQVGYGEGYSDGESDGYFYGYNDGYDAGKEAYQPLGEVDIDSNGQHWVGSYEYANVDVPIPDGYIKPTGTIDIDKNGTHNIKDAEYANVNVPIPSGYIKPTGTLNVTDNGEHDVTQYAKVNVNIATAPPWSQTRSDIAVGTRSVWAISASGGLPSLSPSNTEAAIGVITPNNYGYTDRESETVYVMPVPARANSVTLNSTDGQPCMHHFIGLKESGGKFSIVFDTGKQASNSHTFTAGSITHMLISMERTNGTVFPWGYNDSQITVVFAGEGSALDEWWDKFQNYGNRRGYAGAFANWPTNLIYPKYNIINGSGDAVYMFAYWGNLDSPVEQSVDLAARLEQCGVTLDLSKATNVQNLFYRNTVVTRVPPLNLSSSNYNYNLFYRCEKAVTIGTITAKQSAEWQSGAFYHCDALENITFTPGTIGNSIQFQHSTKLTPESIESIIEGLSDSVSGKTCSINSTAVNNLISEWGSQGWMSLVQSKPNWTITTV